MAEASEGVGARVAVAGAARVGAVTEYGVEMRVRADVATAVGRAVEKVAASDAAMEAPMEPDE